LKLSIHVSPGASRERVIKQTETSWKVYVTAPAEQGKANERVCELVAETLGVRPRQVRIVHGLTQRRKIIEVL
jgi:uncharacterized protein (TIGR00251 family)